MLRVKKPPFTREYRFSSLFAIHTICTSGMLARAKIVIGRTQATLDHGASRLRL